LSFSSLCSTKVNITTHHEETIADHGISIVLYKQTVSEQQSLQLNQFIIAAEAELYYTLITFLSHTGCLVAVLGKVVSTVLITTCFFLLKHFGHF